MRTTAIIRCSAAVAAAVLLAAGMLSTAPVEAQSQGHNLTGTWYFTIPTGLSGFRTFHQDGTLTGNTNVIMGGEPRPGVLRSGDHGIWRQSGGGIETIAFRMGFDETTGNVASIIRIRTVSQMDPGRESSTGEFFVAVWVCLTPTDCPDPTVDSPTIPEFAPPNNTVVSHRVRFSLRRTPGAQ